MDAAVEALADLSATMRGGGRVGADPDQLSATFGDAMQQLARERPVALQVRTQGLLIDGDPFWANDLLARRVGTALDAQGLDGVTVRADAQPRTLRALAVLLARDWSTEGVGALRALVGRGPTPGIEFAFSESVPQAVGGGLEPGVLLNLLRGEKGASHVELAPALDAIRARLAVPADARAAVAGAGLGARQHLDAEIQAIAAGQDVPWEHVGRIAFEVIRLDPAGLQAADSFRLVMDQVDQLLARGNAAEAFALLHQPLSLVDNEVVHDWPHRALVRAEIGALLGDQALGRLVSGANGAREGLDAWRRLIFTMASVMPVERVPGAAPLLSALERPALRQAAADGVVLACGKDAELLDRILHRVSGLGPAVILLAIGRLDAPTLLEKVLARLDSEVAVVRQDALVALRRHRSPRAQQVVRKALHDPVAEVRIEALRYVSVYRDAEAAAPIMERLRGSAADDAGEEELRALGMAFAIIGRQEAVLPLTRLAQEAGDRRPGVAIAAIAGLLSLGESGRASLHGLVRTNPELRRHVRAAGVTE